jgi:hypothetical protein
MNNTLASKRPSATEPTSVPTGMLARKSAIVIGLSLSIVLMATITFAPKLMNSVPLWAVWALAMAGVITAYISGHVMRHKNSRRPSRRTQRWITARQD